MTNDVFAAEDVAVGYLRADEFVIFRKIVIFALGYLKSIIMRKQLKETLLLAAVLAFAAFPAGAQGLGGLLNKVKKTAEKAEKILGSETDEPESQRGNKGAVGQQTLGSGITISNPLAEAMEIVPVGLYGVSTSDNFGNCYLVIKVRMNMPESKVNFGSVGSERMMAVDPAGKSFVVDAGGAYPHQTPEGVMVNVVLNDSGLLLKDVKKSVTEMQMVKFGVYVDYNTKGFVTLRNVPIFWDQSPE